MLKKVNVAWTKMVEKSNFRRQNNETIIFDVFCGQVGRPTATERSKLTQLGGKLTPGGSKLARSWLKAGHKQPSKEQRKQLLQLYTLLRGFAKLGLGEASVRLQGGLKEAKAHGRVLPTKYFVLRIEVLKI